jgi:peptidoglycan/xylan/chitin deacetylase (PgdA/CDA1 family)
MTPHLFCPLALIGAVFASSALAAHESCGPEALGTSRTVEINGAQKLALGLQTYPQTLALGDHEVVLTFDDGPAAPTPAVLDALAEQCVRATFFLIGRNADGMPGVVKREYAEGHSVGYHSMTHPARTLRLMSESAAKADIDRGFQAVNKAAYGVADAKPRTPFFRFPGFADTPALVSWLEGRDIAVFGADLWASDWKDMTPQAELELVMGRLEKDRKGIILFHDPRPSTAKMMPEFLRELKKRGYKVVHMIAGAGPTPIEQAPPGWTSTTEAIIAKTLAPHRREPPRKNAGPGNARPERQDQTPTSSDAPEEQGM